MLAAKPPPAPAPAALAASTLSAAPALRSIGPEARPASYEAAAAAAASAAAAAAASASAASAAMKDYWIEKRDVLQEERAEKKKEAEDRAIERAIGAISALPGGTAGGIPGASPAGAWLREVGNRPEDMAVNSAPTHLEPTIATAALSDQLAHLIDQRISEMGAHHPPPSPPPSPTSSGRSPLPRASLSPPPPPTAAAQLASQIAKLTAQVNAMSSRRPPPPAPPTPDKDASQMSERIQDLTSRIAAIASRSEQLKGHYEGVEQELASLKAAKAAAAEPMLEPAATLPNLATERGGASRGEVRVEGAEGGPHVAGTDAEGDGTGKEYSEEAGVALDHALDSSTTADGNARAVESAAEGGDTREGSSAAAKAKAKAEAEAAEAKAEQALKQASATTTAPDAKAIAEAAVAAFIENQHGGGLSGGRAKGAGANAGVSMPV